MRYMCLVRLVNYLLGILIYKYGLKSDIEIRKKELAQGKIFLSKLFGMGKSDYSKPKEILDKSKEYYELISKELKELDEEE